MKFTFKRDKSTGRYRSFYPDHIRIKLQKKEVGYIVDGPPYTIHLAIKKEKTKQNPVPFKWVHSKRKFGTLQEAKYFLNHNIDDILKKFYLHQFED